MLFPEDLGPVLFVSAALTSVALLLVAWTQRFMLLKPSLIVITLIHLQVQWATAFLYQDVLLMLSNPYPFLMMAHGIPILGLVGSLLVLRQPTQAVWARLRTLGEHPVRPSIPAIVILCVAAALIVSWYLSEVPPTSTALWVLFTDPQQSDLAREYGWKLLPNRFLAYGVSVLNATIAPVLTSLATLWYLEADRSHRVRDAVAAVAIILAMVVVVSIPGTRIAAARLVVVIALTVLLLRGYPMKLHIYAGLLLAALVLPTAISVLRNGLPLTWENLYTWLFQDGIFQRAFVTPMKVGLWYTDYYESYGSVGIAAVPRLASIYSLPTVDVPNVIANLYVGGRIQTESAVTSFIFAYYAYFGPWAIAASLLGLWALDLLVLVYQAILPRLLVAVVVSCTVASTQFVESEYTAVFVTHGLALIPLLAGALGYFDEAWRTARRLRRGPAPVHPV